ncbi:MAG TPA: GntG family PLP-dependent aldolase [Candidatus Hydrogenedentes bacterium]|nr:GntG family PLP-dependent aldolase [Candidatus Hydrogenedentota bacterium]HPG68510.1 GntG family PLP-dependent aldolase [Candidatus Hydrogenedentota bacterium]
MYTQVQARAVARHGKAVELRSDTFTVPTPAMREAMANAAVGDDVYGEDPTVRALQSRAAELMGKEAALFLPSGTMANLVAILAQTRPGDSIILSREAHPINYESGNVAMVAGVLPRPVIAEYGILSADDIAPWIVPRDADHHLAPTTLVSIENTSNRGGGAVYPIETAAAIGDLAHRHGLRVHCDGARIFHAAVASGVPAIEYASHTDTISFCLSKGLGAPVGSVLAGDAATLDVAHRFRKMLGGGMRQAGILAAAGLFALDHHIGRLRDDHRRARRFRELVEGTAGVSFPMPSPTNMVYFEVADGPGTAARLRELGVYVGVTAGRLRAVFHLDVSDEDVEIAADAVRQVLQP